MALLPPLRPGETPLSGPVALIVLVTVRVQLSRREDSVGENLFQLGDEEHLKTTACLSHLRVRLLSGIDGDIAIRSMAGTVIVTEFIDGCTFLTHIIELCAVAEHEVDISNKLVW